MFTVDAALQQTCAHIREQATRGLITRAERDLLMDGAILLAVHLEGLIQDAHAAAHPTWPEAAPSHRIDSLRTATAA